MSMLHKKYDWTRTVFIASVCLTLFLGSQSPSMINNVDSNEAIKGITGIKPMVLNGNADNIFESNSEDNFGIVRR